MQIKTTYENDTITIKRFNTARRMDIQLTSGDKTVVIPINSSIGFGVKLTSSKNKKNVRVIPAFLSDNFGTVSFTLSDIDYKYLMTGEYVGTVTMNNGATSIPGKFTLIIKESMFNDDDINS